MFNKFVILRKNIFYLFIVIFHLASQKCYTQSNNPKANSNVIVICNNARFTILTPQLIRMEWSKNGKFEDLASLVFINRKLSLPKFTKEEKGEWLIIKTEKLKLFYKINSGIFTKNNLYIKFNLSEKQVKWQPGLKDSLNLKGTMRTLDGNNGEKDASLEDGLLSKNGWYLYDDSETNLFDSTQWVLERDSNSRQDWYFFGYGHDYKKELYDYTTIAGKIPMPPKFALGYWWSRYWAYSDEELRNLIKDMRLHNMPIDVLVIDMDWHTTDSLSLMKPKKDEFGEMIGWTGYSWNNKLFPQPEKFLNWAKKENLKISLNLHPASGIAPYENAYHEFAKDYNFDTIFSKNIPFKIEEKKWVEIYFNKVLNPIQKQGIDFWWIDWQQWLENKSIKNLSNTWWLNYVFFSEMEKQNKNRPLIFHRWGGLGNHRYQIGFSGDSHSTWDALDYQSYFTATAANVGYAYWSHDIGGHVGDDSDPELYLRWIQFGVYSPILRTHCTKSKDIERRMFMYPKHYNIMLEALQMRYALNPYIYNASRYAYDTGLSICRPMYYDYPEKKLAYDYNKQYMFGNEMIVAPIASKAENSLSIKKLWLPEGDWYELYTGSMLRGNNEYVRNYTLNEIPVFVKAGAIIPMYPKTIKNLQTIPDTLILCFIPGGDFKLNIYDDDGNTSDYIKNICSYTSVNKVVFDNGDIKINISATKGEFLGMKKNISYELNFPSSFPPQRVYVNKVEYFYNSEPQINSWTYDAEKLCLRIFIPEKSKRDSIEVQILPQEINVGKQVCLYGKIGVFGRASYIIEKLKYALNTIDPFANLSNNILKTATLKTNIQYSPFNTLEILTDYDKNYNNLINDIKNYTKINDKEINEILKLFVNDVTIISNPVIKLDTNISDKAVKVNISSALPYSDIYYTTDNTMPTENSKPYKGEFFIGKTCEIKARCFKGANMQSFVSSYYFQRIFASNVSYKYNYKAKYDGGGKLALIDGVFASEKDFTKKWIGFEGDDMIATVELIKSIDIKSITARFLEAEVSWIFAPAEVCFEVSSDGKNYKRVFFIDRKEHFKKSNKGENVISVNAVLNENNVKYIRISAKNIGICPLWHYGAGGKAWIFTDELIVE